MARLRTTVNRITERIETDRRRSTRTVCKYGIPLVLLASVIIPVCIPFWAIIWFAIYQSVKKGGSAVMLAGAAGEDHALTHLSGLSDEYTVFNQICLPDSRSRTGFREADFVVVGPNGVFIIENKCNLHLLHGNCRDKGGCADIVVLCKSLNWGLKIA